MEKRLIHGSLFSGIGGFDLAAEWAGMVNAFNCEIDPFCRRVLKYHFPNAEQYEDIQKADFSKWTDRIDVLTGGFPCQPFSLAGKRKGTEDDRYLWPAMLDIIRIVRPRWIVAENVLGIVNWSKGLVFDTVCSDLETNGYEIQPFIIPACGVGAPHRRDRIWFIAHRTDTRLEALRERSNEVHANRLASDSPCPSDASRGGQKVTGLYKRKKSGLTYMSLLNDLAVSGLLPTPTANDAVNSSIPPSQIDRGSLVGTLMRGMLPTPKANDFRSGMANRVGTVHTQQLNDTIAYRTGKTSRLNPLFVEEMMGFPTCWILLPFLQNPSLTDTETPFPDGA